MKKKSKKVLTTGDVARICNTSTRTVQKWFDTGILKGYTMPFSKDRRIRTEDLKQFMLDYNLPLDWLDNYI